MSFYSKIASNIILPVYSYLDKNSVNNNFKFLERSQWWDSDRIEKYQDFKLKKLVSHCYDNVPYYHKIFKARGLKPSDIKSVKDLKKLPILDKDTVRKEKKNLLAFNFSDWNPTKRMTGGTTGKPLHYYTTKESWSWIWSAIYSRHWGWGGYKYGDSKATLGGSSLIPAENPTLKVKLRNLFERNLPLSAVHLDDKIMNNYYTKMKKSKTEYIRGYTSSLGSFADYLKRNDRQLNMKAAFSTAEVLYPEVRKKIEDAFSCEVFDNYGCHDGAGNAAECEIHNGFHHSSELSTLELCDLESNEHVGEGEKGRLIFSDLNNFAMPFLRYSPGDVSSLSNEKCTCGRNLPLLNSIEGRTTEVIKLSNGRILTGPPIVHLFRLFNSVKQYQIVQDRKDSILIRIVKKSNFKDSDEHKIIGVMHHHAGQKINIEIEYVDVIDDSYSSKKRFIISKI